MYVKNVIKKMQLYRDNFYFSLIKSDTKYHVSGDK